MVVMMHSTLGASTCSTPSRVARNKSDTGRILIAWALFEGVVVFGGYSELPVVNLSLGFIRAPAVVAISSAAVDIGSRAATHPRFGPALGPAMRWRCVGLRSRYRNDSKAASPIRIGDWHRPLQG